MASFNRVMLMGNLTRNPELKYTPSGTAVTDLGLAVNESFKNKAGETVEQTCFVDVVVWGRQAETASEFLTKGSPAFIEVDYNSINGKIKRVKRSKLRVRAERVQFLSSGASNGNNSSEFQADSGKVTPEDASLDDDVPFNLEIYKELYNAKKR